MENKSRNTLKTAVAGGVIVLIILILGTIWTGRAAGRDTKTAVHSVSLLYLEELAGRREQVVASNLQKNIDNIYIAIGLMTEEDLKDIKHLQAYQARMKQLYGLEKFAFVDTRGQIYTSLGMQSNISEYDFDYQTLTEPDISIFNLQSKAKKVIIAVPAGDIPFQGETLAVCFMEIDMEKCSKVFPCAPMPTARLSAISIPATGSRLQMRSWGERPKKAI